MCIRDSWCHDQRGPWGPLHHHLASRAHLLLRLKDYLLPVRGRRLPARRRARHLMVRYSARGTIHAARGRWRVLARANGAAHTVGRPAATVDVGRRMAVIRVGAGGMGVVVAIAGPSAIS